MESLAVQTSVPAKVNLAVQDLFDKSLFSSDFWKAFGYFQLRMYAAWIIVAVVSMIILSLITPRQRTVVVEEKKD